MADFNPIQKAIKKHAGRTKERLLQNFGKADKTSDEDFDLHVKNFTNQHLSAMRLQKEFKNYYICLREMQNARRSLMDTVCELYEPCWDGVEKFLIKTEMSNKNFDDFCNKFNEELLAPVGTYVNQFPDYVTKISKRKRKLLDYDNWRHNLQNLEQTSRKREEKKSKSAKYKGALEEAQSQFETINKELHDELPALYDSRVSFFASNLQFVFKTEAEFHKQDGELFVSMSKILNALNEAYKKGSINDLPMMHRFDVECAPKVLKLQLSEGDQPEQSPDSTGDDASKEEKKSDSSVSPERDSEDPKLASNIKAITAAVIGKIERLEAEPPILPSPAQEPPQVLYQVKGTYRYLAEDEDELSFDVGDVIDVIPYDDPDDQEEGWLMGYFLGKKGLFPANFTSRL